MEEKFTAWMPLTKSPDGGFIGILSDDSLDRDDEFMTEELLKEWATDSSPLPMLANHENKIEKLLGGWTDRTLISKGTNNALIAKPFFLKSNPLAVQVEQMINESLEKGLTPGISIGAIPKETVTKEIDGKEKKGYSKAEIVEATVVPIQSNRSATFLSLAKNFDFDLSKKKKAYDKDGAHAHTEEGPLGIHNHPEIESNLRSSIDWMNERIDNLREVVNGLNNPCEENALRSSDNHLTKPKKVEECVRALMRDPKFKPQKGRTKEESAWAVCQSKKEIKEVNKMTEENNEVPEEGKPSEEEAPAEEAPVDGAEKVDGQEKVDAAKEVTDLKLKVAELEKKLDEVLKKAVMANTPTVEKAEVTKTEESVTVEKMLEMKAGGQ